MNYFVVFLTLSACLTICLADEETTIVPINIENESTCQNNKREELKNKELVINMMQEVFGDKDIDAFDKYLDQINYIQHSPDAPDGHQGIKDLLTKMKLQELPKIKLEVQRVVAEGDLVFYHWKSTQLFEGKVASIIDIFRIENDRVHEHWIVIQPFPEKSENPHPLF